MDQKTFESKLLALEAAYVEQKEQVERDNRDARLRIESIKKECEERIYEQKKQIALNEKTLSRMKVTFLYDKSRLYDEFVDAGWDESDFGNNEFDIVEDPEQ